MISLSIISLENIYERWRFVDVHRGKRSVIAIGAWSSSFLFFFFFLYLARCCPGNEAIAMVGVAAGNLVRTVRPATYRDSRIVAKQEIFAKGEWTTKPNCRTKAKRCWPINNARPCICTNTVIVGTFFFLTRATLCHVSLFLFSLSLSLLSFYIFYIIYFNIVDVK